MQQYRLRDVVYLLKEVYSFLILLKSWSRLSPLVCFVQEPLFRRLAYRLKAQFEAKKQR